MSTAHRSSVRPLGWSPGALAFVAAWLVGVAIARLTGAAAVILVLAGTAVALVLELAAGWRAARSADVVEVDAATTATVGTSTPVRVVTRHRGGPVRLTVFGPDGVKPLGSTTGVAGLVDASFDTPGVVEEVDVAIETPGPAGLVWWRRRERMAIGPIHVAPAPAGAPLPAVIDRAAIDGESAAPSGNHGGDIDGVRPWREGDESSGIHWPSTMRTGELIVHDRRATSEQTWTIDIAGLAGADDAGRLRRTLGDGLHAGHRMRVRDDRASTGDTFGGPSGDAPSTAISSDDDAIVWAARVADRGGAAQEPRRRSFLHQELRRRDVEREAGFTTTARLLTALTTAVALGMLLGALGASPAVAIASLVGVAGGAAASLHLARRPGVRPLALRVGTGAAAIGALVWIAADARDTDGLLAALRGPLPELLMLLVVLHGVEVVDRRTLRVHQAIAMVVALYAAGLRLDASLGWWLAAWSIALVAALLATRRPVTPVPGTAQPVAPVPGTASAASRAVRGGAWVAGGVVLTLALLSVVPVPDGPARLGLPALTVDATTVDEPGALVGPDGSPVAPNSTGEPARGLVGGVVGYPGFTEALDTSIRGDLGDQVVLRVRAPEPAFWRGQTFADFDGRTWTVSGGDGRLRSGPDIEVPPTLGDITRTALPTEELVQTYFVEADLPNIVFAAQRATRLVFDGQVWTRPDGALRSDVTLSPGSVYTAVSERIQVTPELLRAQGDIADTFSRVSPEAADIVEPFLRLPRSTSAATIELADSLRAPDGNTYDTILAYQAWLAANTEYDLDAPVPADGADAVDDFLFNSRRGYCEQIASTLAVMLRSQGVPARLATGYVPGERDRVSGVWVVRARDAHSWVEVWFPETGWEPFDPTANVPLAGEADSGTVGGDVATALIGGVTSRPIELALAGVGLLAVLGLAQLARNAAARHRRGRWGVLQDRFVDLAELDPDSGPVTNRSIAAHLDHPRADDLAATLDRVAFDPAWSDDDDAYRRARDAMRDLARSP